MKLFWQKVCVSQGCSLICRMKGVLSKDGEILPKQPYVLRRWAEFYKTYEFDDVSVSSYSEMKRNEIVGGPRMI